MPQIHLQGVPVQFPFTPYDSQRDFMTKVILALQNTQNVLLESPTGTGKTLCLLCSVLGWLETHRAQQDYMVRQSSANTEEMNRLEEQLRAGAGNDMPAGFGNMKIRVIYASRTHSQLSQVMNELKRTSYTGFRTAIIGSRDQLCVHPTVSKEVGNQAKQTSCRVKVQSRTCHYYNNVEKKKDLMDFKNPENPKSNILDIEDLKKLGNKHKCCPYYFSRAAAKESADIIFMPYNYLLDPMIRKRHGIDLDGSIIIFDEAHNLNQVAEDSSSVEISAYDITSALEELDTVITFVENHGQDLLEGDNFTQNNQSEDSINYELLTLENLMKVKAVVHDLELKLMAIELSREKELKKGGEYLYEILSQCKLDFDTYLPVYEIIDASVAYLTSGGYSGTHSKAFGMNKLINFLKVVYESDTYNKSKSPQQRKAFISQFYKVYIHDKQPQKKFKKEKMFGQVSNDDGPVRTIAFWCFSPGFSMQDLQKQGVRCILLTSGTLKPLESFACELGIEFAQQLENPHVISPSQICVSVVKQGPESVTLNSNYQNRSDPRYHTSLGYAIMQIAKSVPNGMLVFFPSYHIMKLIIETWTKGHLLQCIQRYKQIFIEPTNKDEFAQAMEQYYAMVNDHTSNGAIFCGVCRGKVSEGLDFVDKNGRAVVITGIPYAPAKDPKVVMKKAYLDEQLRKPGKKRTLTGTQWYSQQASRAVNQAIGRVIRHRFDYGAILLLDTRFANSNTREELPAWVKSEIKVHDTFSSVIRMLNQFFTTVPSLVERRKAEAGVLAEPEKPTSRPQIQISYESANQSSGSGGMSARAVYSDKSLQIKQENRSPTNIQEDSVSQPARKKIKMQMVPGLTEKAEPVRSAESQTKLNSATEVLQKCRTLLAHDKWVGIKRSFLIYHKTKEIPALEDCIKVLLESEVTHHVVDCLRGLVNPKKYDEFDSLVTKLKSSIKPNPTPDSKQQAGSSSSPDGSLNTSPADGSSESAKAATNSRYSSLLIMMQTCKKQLSKDQNQIVKSSLKLYQSGGSIHDLFTSLRSIGHEDSMKIVKKLRAALREADKPVFDDLLSEVSDSKTISSNDKNTQSNAISTVSGDRSVPSKPGYKSQLSAPCDASQLSTSCDSILTPSSSDQSRVKGHPGKKLDKESQQSESLSSDSETVQSSCTVYSMSTEVESSLPDDTVYRIESCDIIPASDSEDVIHATPP